jgi:hypothetical protein
MWLRHAESLRYEEKMVHVCEPEVGRNLSDEDELRSLEDLRDCQEGRTEISNCQEGRTEISNSQEGNKMRSLQDLINCQEYTEGISHFQEGDDMRSLQDLIDC